MDLLGSILPKVLHKRGLHGHAKAALVTYKARAWLVSALPQFAEQLNVDQLKDAVLTVSTSHPLVSQECLPLLPTLKEFLCRECGAGCVREIRLMRSR